MRQRLIVKKTTKKQYYIAKKLKIYLIKIMISLVIIINDIKDFILNVTPVKTIKLK